MGFVQDHIRMYNAMSIVQMRETYKFVDVAQ